MFNLNTHVFVYLLGTFATLVVVLTGVWHFVVVRRKAQELDVLEQRIPDAARFEDLKARVGDLQTERDRLQETVLEAQSIIEKKAEAQRWLEENEERLRSVRAEREEQERVRAQLEQLQAQYAQEYERCASLRTEKEGLEFHREKLREELKDIEPKVEHLRTQERELQTSIGSLQGEQARLQQLVASWKQQAEEVEKEIERLRKNRDDVAQQIGKDLDRLRSERDAIAKEVQDRSRERDELNGELSVLKRDKARLEVEAGKQKDRLADLWQPRLSSKQFENPSTQGELARLGELREYLLSLRLRFPDRVLKAFHTSLKVAQVNPLVVLAGISGTGKSELPRRYAEAFGMHFLNIAVQPRWDSPQDMFGFFNYMEGRYRATELARALVQMDRYCLEETKADLSKHMLVVLLDEMNLARVEYYFSEFLSRLEIRRGINVENADDRRKAEIPLEVGGVGGADSILRLFVDTNVLFVGTMNEDETTQTLSDKVVDRANVLRFGKPMRLRDEDDARPGVHNISKQYTPYLAWKSWIKKPDDMTADLDEKVSRWIDQLNDIMTKIRRPFAYRTRLAIRSYVANYPQEDHDRSAQWALSDQIEQKILPKFRGLDPSEPSVRNALGELTNLLSELEDPVLKAAVDESRRAGEHLFMWQGIDRTKAEE